MRKRLVVAHYKEDLNWLNRINQDVVKFIYHKDTNLTDYREKLQVTENEFQLCNVGRESHTYLKHIIDNYDDLYEIWDYWKKDPQMGHVIWCIKRRNELPQKPMYDYIMEQGIWDLDSMGLEPNYYDAMLKEHNESKNNPD